MFAVALLSSWLLSTHAQAKTFQTSYVTFELPDQWTCVQEGVAWACNHTDPVQSKEALLVINARVAGPEDNLNAFLAYLKQPKTLPTKVGTPMPSKVMYAQNRSLTGITWVQALHLGSEIQDFYTLYLATVKNQLAILINFSAEKTQFQKHNKAFDQLLRTIKITANQDILFPKAKQIISNEALNAVDPKNTLDPNDIALPPDAPARPKNPLVSVLLLAGLVAVIAALVWKRRTSSSSGSKKRTHRPK